MPMYLSNLASQAADMVLVILTPYYTLITF